MKTLPRKYGPQHIGVAVCLLFLMNGAAAQDSPLVQILIDGESWQAVDANPRMFLEVEVPRGELAAGDSVKTGRGSVYFTLPDQHAVYVIVDGKKRLVAEGIPSPTRLALWPDEGTLVVSDPTGKHLWTFRIDADGGLSGKEPYYTLRTPPGTKASGAGQMTVDKAGHLYVTSTLGIQVFDPTGRLSGVLTNPPGGVPISVTFGGADNDTLYVTCGDKVYCRKTKAKGAK